VVSGYLTTKQAAARLGVSDARIRQMIGEGIIQHSDQPGGPGSVLLIPEAEVSRLESTERKVGRPAKKA
jgi:excisionase family DNA binding protein